MPDRVRPPNLGSAPTPRIYTLLLYNLPPYHRATGRPK